MTMRDRALECLRFYDFDEGADKCGSKMATSAADTQNARSGDKWRRSYSINGFTLQRAAFSRLSMSRYLCLLRPSSGAGKAQQVSLVPCSAMKAAIAMIRHKKQAAVFSSVFSSDYVSSSKYLNNRAHGDDDIMALTVNKVSALSANRRWWTAEIWRVYLLVSIRRRRPLSKCCAAAYHGIISI